MVLGEYFTNQLSRLGYESPWKAIGVAEHIGSHGLSESCIRLAKGWLESRLHRQGNHFDCAIEGESILPTRVIDVGSPDADDFKLHISSKNERGRYVALSHCWGGSTPVMTTMANIGKFMKRIPTPLPKAFADAVAVARALGIQYLWFDSLCIIQDSREDWSNQAPHLASVYGSAYVTIAADAASNSSQGFLNHPNRQLSAPVPVTYEGITEENLIWVRERGALGYQLPFHDWTGKVSPFTGRDPPSFLKKRGESLRRQGESHRGLKQGLP